jgi:hypothetical protein
MSPMKTTLNLIWQIIWRSFGLGLVTIPGGMGIGSAIPGGNWVMGGVIAWASTVAIVATVLGVAIATTGKVTDLDITSAFSQAVQKALDEQNKK